MSLFRTYSNRLPMRSISSVGAAKLRGGGHLPCLASLGDGPAEQLHASARIRSVAGNTVLFEEYDPADSVFSILTGAVQIFTASREGRELVIENLAPGQCVCCASLHGRRRHYASARSLENSTLIAFPAEKFRTLLSGSPPEIGQAIIACLSSRFGRLFSLLGDLAFRDVEERVMIVLHRLAGERRCGNSRTISLAVTHQDIASMTGTVREVVSRTMSKLRKERVITATSVRGFTLDQERLLKLLGG